MHPGDHDIQFAARLLREGKLVAFPTETVYGLGAHALDEKAVKRIYEVKRRPHSSPLIVHVSSWREAKKLTSEWPQGAQRLAESFWPGPLTLVLPKSGTVPDIVTAGLPSVGVRVPSHPVALALLKAAAIPVAAPSANRFMSISPTSAEHVREELGGEVDYVLDGGPTQVGIESTVVSFSSGHPVLLRPGILTRDQLEAAIGEKLASRNRDRPAESPGLHPRHYAPRTKLILFNEESELPQQGRGRVLELPAEPDVFAASLYAELRKADHEGWDWIAIRRPANTPEWEGILDRLTRAST